MSAISEALRSTESDAAWDAYVQAEKQYGLYADETQRAWMAYRKAEARRRAALLFR